MRWRLPRPDRTTVFVAIGALLFAATYAGLASYIRSYYERTAPNPSVFSESGRGLSVYFRYLDRLGLKPLTLQQFDDLPPAATIVIAGPLDTTPAPGEAARLASWVRGGGRLVLVSSELQGLLDGLGAQAMPGKAAAGSAVEPSLPGAYAVGVRRIAAGVGRLEPADTSWVVHYRDAAGPALLTRSLGRGEIVWLADARAVSNDGIGLQDDARLAVLLAAQGGRAIYFDEFHHGFVDEASVWDRLGYGGQAATVLLLLGLGLVVVAGARRIGPPVPPLAESAARGGAYIGQLAELYRKAGARAEALEALEDGLARALTRRYGTRAGGLARQPRAAEALAASAALRAKRDIERDEFLAAAKRLRRARMEVEG